MIHILDIINIQNPHDYKLHLACRNDEAIEPLDVYVSSKEDWIKWNEWRGRRNDWTRKYILSFIDFYPQRGTYLFGGAFEIIETNKEGYKIKEVDQFKKYEGRLLCNFKRKSGLRGRAFKLENHVSQLEVQQIFDSIYSGATFCGLDKINHFFSELKPIILNEKQDWKSSLSVVKGVYLIQDTSNGKMYVGSAYGDSGIWSRLTQYIHSGHGGNDQLKKIIDQKSYKYALQHFKYSILEVFTFKTSDEVIISRENYWKETLQTRVWGYNSN